MSNIWKRIVAMALALVLVVGMMPVGASAAEDCAHHSEHTAECG